MTPGRGRVTIPVAGGASMFHSGGMACARLLVLIVGLGLGACGPTATHPTSALANRPAGVATQPAPRRGGLITAEALSAYVAARFPAAVADGTLVLDFGSGGGVGDDVIEELHILGIDDMAGVAALVPADFERKGFAAIRASQAPTSTVAGLMRDLMVMHDPRGYFEKAWRHGWVTTGPQDFPAPIAYGVDFDVVRDLGVFEDAP